MGIPCVSRSLSIPFHVQSSCIVEFDGSSKGNPGQAGAGAILRASDMVVQSVFANSIIMPSAHLL